MMRQVRNFPFLLASLGLFAGSFLTAVAGCGNVVGPSSPDWAACTAPGQCQLQAKGCCGTCNVPTVNDVNGVNRDQIQGYEKDNCPEPAPCVACLSAGNPNLAAFCVQDTCKPINVRGDDVSSCTTDADCRLRFSDCCEQCGGAGMGGVIALSQTGASTYQKQVCAPDQACDKCIPVYPAGVKAVCEASKHCAAVPVAG
jgi:hypothetical protein